MDRHFSLLVEAPIALLMGTKAYLSGLLSRAGEPERTARVGFWIQLEDGAESLKQALADCLRRHGVMPVPLQEQAASELYRHTRWRDRIAWHAGQKLDIVVVGRLRDKATNDIGNPYAWVLDFRYFYPLNGAQLSARQLSTYIVGERGAFRALAAKATRDIVKALWLMESDPVPPDPGYGYDTSSWPFAETIHLIPEAEDSAAACLVR